MIEFITAKENEYVILYTPFSTYDQSELQSLSHYISISGMLLIEKIFWS